MIDRKLLCATAVDLARFRTPGTGAALAASLLLLLFVDPLVADWPEYRGNVYRSGYREQPLAGGAWEPAWRSEDLSSPSPAWPDPARGSLWQNLESLSPRVADDQANVVLVMHDKTGSAHVIVTSVGDHRLVSLDPMSGELRWQFVADAPIRFAPCSADGTAYFGADDGFVRALDVGTGQIIWETRVGPRTPWIAGNGRLLSTHPIRTSVLLHEGKVLAHAGLFPSQGVYSAALGLQDGSLIWRRRLERSPQGYLLMTDDGRAIVPSGRATPYAIDPDNGQTLHDLPSPGGSFCMVTPEAIFTGPGNSAQVQARDRSEECKLLPFGGRAVAAGGGYLWTADGGTADLLPPGRSAGRRRGYFHLVGRLFSKSLHARIGCAIIF